MIHHASDAMHTEFDRNEVKYFVIETIDLGIERPRISSNIGYFLQSNRGNSIFVFSYRMRWR